MGTGIGSQNVVGKRAFAVIGDIKMAKPELSLDQAYNELHGWAKSLLLEIEGSLAEIRKALEPKFKLAPECPSRASQALAAFSGVQKKIGEVERLAKAVEEAMGQPGATSTLALKPIGENVAAMFRALDAIHDKALKLTKKKLPAGIQTGLTQIVSLTCCEHSVMPGPE